MTKPFPHGELMQVFTVRIRRDYSRPVRPEALQVDGNSYVFEKGWTMEADDPYPGEVAWIPHDPTYPLDAPPWIAGGDLEPCFIDLAMEWRDIPTVGLDEEGCPS